MLLNANSLSRSGCQQQLNKAWFTRNDLLNDFLLVQTQYPVKEIEMISTELEVVSQKLDNKMEQCEHATQCTFIERLAWLFYWIILNEQSIVKIVEITLLNASWKTSYFDFKMSSKESVLYQSNYVKIHFIGGMEKCYWGENRSQRKIGFGR